MALYNRVTRPATGATRPNRTQGNSPATPTAVRSYRGRGRGRILLASGNGAYFHSRLRSRAKRGGYHDYPRWPAMTSSDATRLSGAEADSLAGPTRKARERCPRYTGLFLQLVATRVMGRQMQGLLKSEPVRARLIDLLQTELQVGEQSRLARAMSQAQYRDEPAVPSLENCLALVEALLVGLLDGVGIPHAHAKSGGSGWFGGPVRVGAADQWGTQPGIFTAHATAPLARAMRICSRLNPQLQVKGMFFTRFDKRKVLRRETAEDLRSHYPDLVLTTVIRESIALGEAPHLKQDIFSYAPESAGAVDYNALVQEILTPGRDFLDLLNEPVWKPTAPQVESPSAVPNPDELVVPGNPGLLTLAGKAGELGNTAKPGKRLPKSRSADTHHMADGTADSARAEDRVGAEDGSALSPVVAYSVDMGDARQTFVVRQHLLEQLRDYVHARRAKGDYAYSQKQALEEALLEFLAAREPAQPRPPEVHEREQQFRIRVREGNAIFPGLPISVHLAANEVVILAARLKQVKCYVVIRAVLSIAKACNGDINRLLLLRIKKAAFWREKKATVTNTSVEEVSASEQPWSPTRRESILNKIIRDSDVHLWKIEDLAEKLERCPIVDEIIALTKQATSNAFHNEVRMEVEGFDMLQRMYEWDAFETRTGLVPDDRQWGGAMLCSALQNTKPKHLVHGKNFTVRFTQSEWDGILLKATLAGDTPTTIVRAGALGLELRAVLSRVWTDAERVDYRALIKAANNFNEQSKREDLEPHERSQLQKLLSAYVLQQQGKLAEVLAVNGVRVSSPAEMAADFTFQRSTRPDVTMAAEHVSLAWPPSETEKLTNEVMTQAARRYMQVRGIDPEQTQWVVARHYDEDHPHCHLLLNRVTNNGSLLPDKFSKQDSLAACRQVEAEMGFVDAKELGLAQELAKAAQPGQPVEKLHRLQLKALVTQALKQHLPTATTMTGLQEALRTEGIEVKIILQKEQSRGAVFTAEAYPGLHLKGSEIDRQYGAQELFKTLEAQEKRAQQEQLRTILLAALEKQVPQATNLAELQLGLAREGLATYKEQAQATEAGRLVLKELAEVRENTRRELQPEGQLVLEHALAKKRGSCQSWTEYKARVEQAGFAILEPAGQPAQLLHVESGELFDLALLQPGGATAPNLRQQVEQEGAAQQEEHWRAERMLVNVLKARQFTSYPELDQQLQAQAYKRTIQSDGKAWLEHEPSGRQFLLVELFPNGQRLEPQAEAAMARRQTELVRGQVEVGPGAGEPAAERAKQFQQLLEAAGAQVIAGGLPVAGRTMLEYRYEWKGATLETVNQALRQVQAAPGVLVREQDGGFQQPESQWPVRAGEEGRATLVIAETSERMAAERVEGITSLLREKGAWINAERPQRNGTVELELGYRTQHPDFPALSAMLDKWKTADNKVELLETPYGRLVRAEVSQIGATTLPTPAKGIDFQVQKTDEYERD
nr:hypothetical protein [Tanacetum cinerariifolium]